MNIYIHIVIYNTIYKLKTHWHQQFLPFVTLYGRGNSWGVSGALSLESRTFSNDSVSPTFTIYDT